MSKRLTFDIGDRVQYREKNSPTGTIVDSSNYVSRDNCLSYIVEWDHDEVKYDQLSAFQSVVSAKHLRKISPLEEIAQVIDD